MSEPIYKVYKAMIKNVDAENFTVNAIVTTETPDRDNEVVTAQGFEKGLQEYRKHPVLLSCHDWYDLRKNIGQAEDFSFKDGETQIKFRYFANKGNEEADWAFKLAQEGIAAYSIGFIPKEWRKPDDSEKALGVQRVYTDLEVLEISQVLIPSNRNALQVRQKMASVEEELCTQAIQNTTLVLSTEMKKVIPYKDLGVASEAAEWDGNKETAAADIDVLRLICTWYDAEKPDVKSSYKLPHHRAAGNHPAVWRGVAAAMGALLGARGGVDIPEGDRRGCYNHLVRHYKAFEKEPPEFKEYSAADMEIPPPPLYPPLGGLGGVIGKGAIDEVVLILANEEISKDMIRKPYENEHACRLRDPDDFQDDSFRRMIRVHEDKEYSVIMGKLKGEDTMTEQAYRYKKDIWTASKPQTHCKDHKGKFEAAKGENSLDEEKKSTRGIFEIEGFTEPTNEHYHEFRMSKDMNGIIVGQTLWAFNVNYTGDMMWNEVEQHKHLIIERDVTAEMEGHTHEITVFKSLSMIDEKDYIDKEGRTLSAATLSLLQEVQTALEVALGKMKELVASTMTEPLAMITEEAWPIFDTEVWGAINGMMLCFPSSK